MVTVEDQKELEQSMVKTGQERFRSSLNKMMSKGLESNTKHGRAIISSAVHLIGEGASELKNEQSNRGIAKAKLENMDKFEVAYLAMLSLVDSLSKRATLLNVAQRIGMRIEDQQRLEMWIEEDADVAKMIIKMANEKTASGRHQKRHGLTHKMNKDGYKHTEWMNEERIHVGLKMIDVIIRTTGIVSLRRQTTSRGKTSTFVEATVETLKWIKSFNEVQEVAKPRYAPCIIPPKDWKDLWGGGFHNKIINRLPLVRTH
jgi:DNA-directed RNA polymerase